MVNFGRKFSPDKASRKNISGKGKGSCELPRHACSIEIVNAESYPAGLALGAVRTCSSMSRRTPVKVFRTMGPSTVEA